MKKVEVTYKTKQGHTKVERVICSDYTSLKAVERSVLKCVPFAHEVVSSEVVKVW